MSDAPGRSALGSPRTYHARIPWQQTTSHPNVAQRYKADNNDKAFPRDPYTKECHTCAVDGLQCIILYNIYILYHISIHAYHFSFEHVIIAWRICYLSNKSKYAEHSIRLFMFTITEHNNTNVKSPRKYGITGWCIQCYNKTGSISLSAMTLRPPGRGGGALTYMSSIGMCRDKDPLFCPDPCSRPPPLFFDVPRLTPTSIFSEYPPPPPPGIRPLIYSNHDWGRASGG